MIIVSAIDPGRPAPERCARVSTIDDAVPVLETLQSDAVLVHPASADGRAARVAREILGRHDVARVAVGGSLTRRAAVVWALTLLPPEGYGMAQYVADAVVSAARTRAAMSSVSRLSQARPSLGQHARSLFPGGSFDVDLDAGTVRSVSPIRWNVGRGQDVFRCASASPGGLKVELSGATRVIDIDPPSVSPFGVRSWVEVSMIADLRGVVEYALRTARIVSCHGCGRSIPGSGCPFCGTTLGASNPIGDRFAVLTDPR